jgi:RNA polymerase sigma-70 factor (ECF subfamily)
MHFVDGLTIDEIGALYQVHRATAARWISGARNTLLADTRARLTARLALTPSQFDSLMRLVRSELDLSLQRLVR